MVINAKHLFCLAIYDGTAMSGKLVGCFLASHSRKVLVVGVDCFVVIPGKSNWTCACIFGDFSPLCNLDELELFDSALTYTCSEQLIINVH
jgi:hypothetical protein